MGASARAFTVGDSPKVVTLGCNTLGNHFSSAKVGDKITIECPPKCSFEE